MRRAVLALAVAACAAAPASASADTFYVNQSAPGTSNSNACTDPGAPCLTIQGAVDKAKASAGNDVRVLPDPNGFTDTYAEAVTINGPNAVTLEGAGSGAGGTHVVGPNFALETISTSIGGSVVRNLRISGPSARSAILVGFGVVVESVVAEHPTQAAAFVGGGVIRDSSLTGPTGVMLYPAGKVVRSRITATSTGIGPFFDPSKGSSPGINGSVVDTIVSGPVGTGATGLRALYGALINQSVRLRHVTFLGFDTRVATATPSSMGSNLLEAVNSTFAGPAGTVDLLVGDGNAKASLINVNRSPARTTKGTGTIEELNPLDVDPLLSADGHLLAGSPLIDAGTTAGFLAGDPDDTLDVDGEARLLGAAPDVGADELPPPASGPDPGPPPGGGPDTTAPVMSSVRVPKRFRSRCPRPRPPGCRAGMTVRLTLSEAGTVQLLFRRRRAVGSARPLRVRFAAKAGANRLRFSGRIRRRALRRGRYRLSITATDAAGNRSAAVGRRVRVL